MSDFSLQTHKTLVQSFDREYVFHPFWAYIEKPITRSIILRHDVDGLPMNSLKTAIIEHQLGFRNTYYFRIVPQSNHVDIIRQIVLLGHEIGYHYEDLALCNGNMDEAIKSFEKNLKYFRQFYPVKTICMHGSPLSKYDNRKLWEKYDYRDFGIVAEPYFDVDYTKVLYLTDTGRRWDGESFSVRDKVRVKVISDRYSVIGGEASRVYGVESKEKDLETCKTVRLQDCKTDKTNLWKGDQWDNGPLDKKRKMVSRDENGILIHNFHSTFDIIQAAEENRLPDQIMITVHPQRWTNNPILWTKELVMQNLKNQVKRYIASKKG